VSHRCVRPVFDSFRTINTTRSLPLFFSIATFVTVVVGWQIYLSCLTAVAFWYKTEPAVRDYFFSLPLALYIHFISCVVQANIFCRSEPRGGGLTAN
jgi:hypothetical protein